MVAAAATSDARATDAAARVLRSGGNAVDAAVTAALVLYVVEPQSCGVGGDGFLIWWDGGPEPVALDGSGAIPVALTEARLAADGLATVPARGGRSVTVPGAVALLETALAQWGTISLAEALAPATAFARDGFTVSASLATAAARAAGELAGEPVLGPLYVPGGRAVTEGQVLANPALADCLAVLAGEGSVAIHLGSLGAAILDAVQADGGYLDTADLAAHQTLPVHLERLGFAGHTVWELPQPTQGPAVLGALARLDDEAPVDWQGALDAMRVAMAEAGFDPAGVVTGRPSPAKGDTTYLAVVDHEGRAASLITSVFGDFGSHLGVPALGGPIHNRATTLRMLRRPPTPGKPPHTTIPAMVTNPDGFRYALGVAGGMMQPQAQVQLVLRLLLEGATPQEAIDAPRFKILFGGDLALEAGHPLGPLHPEALARPAGPEGFGGAQVAGWHEGQLLAGADPRRGGGAMVIS